MASRRSRSARRSASTAARVRARVIAQWRGGVDPPSPTRNIHQPGEFIEDLLKVMGISEGIEEEKLREVWNRVAGDFVAQHTVPESIRDGILVLRVLQPAMKFHLQQMSGKLLENVREELGRGVVKQVIFRIG